MKNKIVYVLLLMTMVLTGCQNRTNINDKNVEVEDIEQSVTPIEQAKEEVSEPILEEPVMEQIKEQSFDLTLDGWGDVTFASFMPKDNTYSEGDVEFKLLKDSEVIYNFPGVTEDNTRFNQQFSQVAAVSFKDFNDDGRKDVIVIIEYTSISGPSANQSYNEARVYIQQEGAKEFVLDPLLYEFLIKQHYNDSINSIMGAKEEYKDYIASLDGSRSVEHQLKLMADNMDLWKELLDYADDVCKYTITDLDNNGRLELIVSQMGGTGIYTYSRFFEINETYDGLIECSNNFIEGDSQPDIIGDSAVVYYDSNTDTYYYIFDDLSKNGVAEYYESIHSLSFKKGHITDTPLALRSTIYSSTATTITHTNAEGKDITEDEYLSSAEMMYGNLEKDTVTFSWHDLKELEILSREEVAVKLQETWEKK